MFKFSSQLFSKYRGAAERLCTACQSPCKHYIWSSVGLFSRTHGPLQCRPLRWPVAHTFLCVLTTVLHRTMNKDRVTFIFQECFVKCTFSTKLTCNRSTNKLAAVANIVLCAQCSSLGLLSLWPCTWTLTVRFFLQANPADVFDSLSPKQWVTARERPLCMRRLFLILRSACLSRCGFVCFRVSIPFVS